MLQVVNRHRGQLQGVVLRVRVELRRKRCVLMPDPCCDYRHGHPVEVHQPRRSVSSAVQLLVPHAHTRQRVAPLATEHCGAAWITDLVRHYASA